MKPRLALLAALTAIAPLASAGCRANLGSADPRVIGLGDEVRLDGGMALAFDRDGALREVVADVDPAKVPAAALQAARLERPGAPVVGAARVLLADGAEAWEVRLVDAGARVAVLVGGAQNDVLATEAEIRRDQAPVAVLRGADAALPGGTFQGVAELRRGGARTFRVTKDRDGASYAIVLDERGAVLSLARAVRAAIEIPLEK